MGAGVDTERYRVKEEEVVRLHRWPPGDTAGYKGREADALGESRKLTKKLERLQEVLFAEHKRKVLVILQAMDTGGKDGTIKKVFEGVNPQGVRVSHFREPTQEELGHDFLWRIHQRTPEKGEMMIFNRSHYEDVLVARVHDLVPRKVWHQRYKDIRHFEALLQEDRCLVLKFFLHIDKDEQKRRLEERLSDPTKMWKFSSFDLSERRLWPKYMKAYEDALEQTSTDASPWYVIPSNKKWFRDMVVSTILVERLEKLGMEYPKVAIDKNVAV